MRSNFSGALCLFLLMGMINFSYSQNKNEESNYNLPPGYYINPNEPVFDLSDKLLHAHVKDIPALQINVILKDIPENELQNAPLEYQQYVKEGEEFISSLSDKVKEIYTEHELWYIYAFDQKLKMRLTQIQ